MNVSDALKCHVWAVVGATPKQEKFGYKVFRTLLDNGYKVYPIHPTAETIDGINCYKCLDDLPQIPDVVNLVVGEKVGLETVGDCARLGVKAIWMQPGADKPKVVETVQEKGVEVVQDCVLIQLEK